MSRTASWIGLAAVLGAHLNDLFRGFDDVASLPCLGEDVGEGLLDIAVFAGADDFDAQLGVLEVAGGDHDAIDVFLTEHVFGVLVELWVRDGRRCVPGLRGARGRDSRYRRGRRSRRGSALEASLDHVDVAVTASTAAELGDADAVVGARTRHRIWPSCRQQHCSSGLLKD